MTTNIEIDWRAGVHTGGDRALVPGMYVTAYVAADDYVQRNAAVAALRTRLEQVGDIPHVGYGSLPVGQVIGTPTGAISALGIAGAVKTAAPGAWRLTMKIESAAPNISPASSSVGTGAVAFVQAPVNAVRSGATAVSNAVSSAVDGVGNALSFTFPTWLKTLLFVLAIGAMALAALYIVKVLPTAVKVLGKVGEKAVTV